LLGADALGEGTFAAIEQHVVGCPECKAVLERLAHPHHDPTTVLPGPARFPHIPGFEIQCELGSGAMGVVYRAVKTGLDRPVALKILTGASGSDPISDTRRHWLREARAVSLARHPNVVPLYDFGEADGCFYLVLEYVPGGSLKRRLGEPLPPRVAARLVETMAHAVGHLHGRGLLHLDLKPSNILLDCEENAAWDRVTPRISDFGLAVSDGGHDVSETSLAFPRGTPSYMAPEQAAASRGQLGAATDIHALGAILYELLTGRPPFQGASTLETLDQVRHQNPVPPRRLNPKIPRGLETIALKCLEKNPSRRYASAEALAGDLRRWLDGKPISARPVSPIERAWRWCRRRPAVASLIAALGATVLMSFVVLFAFYRHADDQRRRAEAAHQRAEEQRLRAEMTRREAEQNLEIAAAVIDPLEQLVMSAFQGKRPLEGDQLDRTAKLLREQIARVRTNRTFPPELLARLGQINWEIAGRLLASGRLDEARGLTREKSDLMRQCREFDPENEDYLWGMVHAFWSSGLIEIEAQRFEPALNHLDQATSLVLETASTNAARLEFACYLFEAYRRVQGRLAPGGSHEARKRAREGQLKMLTLFKPEGSERPDLLLCMACALADHGEWVRARGFVESLATKRRPVPLEPPWLRQNVERRLAEWFARELWHWDSREEGRDVGLEDRDRWADEMVHLLADLRQALGIPGALSPHAIAQMTHELATRAAIQRREGRLDEADRTVASLMAIAQRLVREFPAHPRAHVMLSEAFLQESKKGWRRNDLKAIQRGLAQSIEELQRALTLDPHDDLARRCLQDH
jgi:hypothetical protein